MLIDLNLGPFFIPIRLSKVHAPPKIACIMLFDNFECKIKSQVYDYCRSTWRSSPQGQGWD